MMRGLGRWAVETRLGGVLTRVSVAFLILGGAYAVIGEEIDRQTDPIVKRLKVIERVEPIDVLRECLRTPECRDLFRHPERVRPIRKEVVAGSGNSPSSQPSPGDEPGDKGGSKVPQDKAPAPRKPRQRPPKAPSASQPAPQDTPSVPPPESSPGNSGETPGADKGLKNCVELVVSACVDVPRLQ